MSDLTVIGIDVGIRKSGVCRISGNRLRELKTINTAHLRDWLEEAESTPKIIVIDAPIDPTNGGGFRDIDRAFMRGQFNNNHAGLQPNNPDLLNLGGIIECLKGWCCNRGIFYSNQFPLGPFNEGRQGGILRETMPNVSLGILSSPQELRNNKTKLRFRYGRGNNVAPIVVAYETAVDTEKIREFLNGIGDAPCNWAELEDWRDRAAGQGVDRQAEEQQADDLIAALVCAVLGWLEVKHGNVGYVKGSRGHYVLPPPTLIDGEWKEEIRRILNCNDFSELESNIF